MKKILSVILIISIISLLNSCALFRRSANATPRVEIAKGEWITLPRPAALGFDLTATQVLTATYHIKQQAKSYTSQVQVEVTANKIVLIALSGFGSELFSLNYDGHSLQSSSLPMPNAAMGVKHTLTDFMLTYASPKLIRALLKTTNIQLQLKPHQRLLLENNKVIIKIDYQTDDLLKGIVIFNNKLLNYTVKITTISHTMKKHVEQAGT